MTSKPKVPSCLCLPDLGWHYRHVPPIVFPKLNCAFFGSCALCGLSVLPFPSSHPIASTLSSIFNWVILSLSDPSLSKFCGKVVSVVSFHSFSFIHIHSFTYSSSFMTKNTTLLVLEYLSV